MTKKPTKKELLTWGYTQAPNHVRWLVNCIHTGCGNQYRKLLGLHNYVVAQGRELNAGPGMYTVRLDDGKVYDFSHLETLA